MKEMVFEWLIASCVPVSCVMIIHEMVKTAIYLLQKKADASESCFFA